MLHVKISSAASESSPPGGPGSAPAPWKASITVLCTSTSCRGALRLLTSQARLDTRAARADCGRGRASRRARVAWLGRRGRRAEAPRHRERAGVQDTQHSGVVWSDHPTGGHRSATSVGATTAPLASAWAGYYLRELEPLTRHSVRYRAHTYAWYTRATSFKSCACCMYLRMDHCARVQCQSSWAQSSGLSPAHQLFISSIHVRTPISAPAGEESPRRECARTVYTRQIPALQRRASGSPLEDRAG